ncbi:MAG TPA: hypothetical protein V6D47_05800 [Oscillatoriaceae cyanobacterium]
MSQTTQTQPQTAPRHDGDELHGLALVALLESRLAVNEPEPEALRN